MGEDEIVEGSANEGMRIRNLLWPKFKDLPCPWGNDANNSQVVHERIELSSSGDKVCWIG